jgi:hypothetical protein
LLRPQEPMQREARIDEAPRRLQVKDKSWRPCEKMRSTAVDVASESEISYIYSKRIIIKTLPGMLR